MAKWFHSLKRLLMPISQKNAFNNSRDISASVNWTLLLWWEEKPQQQPVVQRMKARIYQSLTQPFHSAHQVKPDYFCSLRNSWVFHSIFASYCQLWQLITLYALHGDKTGHPVVQAQECRTMAQTHMKKFQKTDFKFNAICTDVLNESHLSKKCHTIASKRKKLK